MNIVIKFDRRLLAVIHSGRIAPIRMGKWWIMPDEQTRAAEAFDVGLACLTVIARSTRSRRERPAPMTRLPAGCRLPGRRIHHEGTKATKINLFAGAAGDDLSSFSFFLRALRVFVLKNLGVTAFPRSPVWRLRVSRHAPGPAGQSTALDEDAIAEIRDATNRGWVTGSDRSRQEIERALSRRVDPLKKDVDAGKGGHAMASVLRLFRAQSKVCREITLTPLIALWVMSFAEWRIMAAAMIVGLPLCTWALPAMAMDGQGSQHMSESELVNRGKELRRDLDARYQTLVKESALVPAVRGGNDVTDVVLKTIPIGTSFDDAEKILAEAGFSVGPRPGPNTPGTDMRRFDVVGSINPYVQHMFGRVKLFVNLSPPAPGEYGRVTGISAGFIESSL